MKHLGNVLNYNLDESADVTLKRGDLVSRVNKMIGSLHGASDNVLMKVFGSQCCHFYGTSAWMLNDRNISQFHTMYNRCVRRILKLPFRTHTRYLPLLAERANSREEIVARFVRLLFSALQSDNSLIRHVSNRALATTNSIIGANMDYIKTTYRISFSQISTFDFRKQHLQTITQEDLCNIQAIKDIKNFEIDFFEINEFFFPIMY